MASSSSLGKEEEAVSTCDMRTIDATNLPAPVLAKMLQTVREPVLVRGALGELWPLHDQFVERFGGVGVEVTHVGPTGFGWARPVPKNDHRYLLGGQMADARLASLTIAELNTAIANGTATEDTYCFHDVVDEVPLMDALASLTHLNDHLLVQRHAPKHWDAKTRRSFLGSAELRNAVRGGAYLTMGAHHSGGPFHTHTDALLGAISGRKRWFVSRNGSHVALTDEEFRHGRARQVLPKLEAHQYWSCVQEAGELLWVPEGLSHTVLNQGNDATVGVSMQSTLLPYSFLHRAAANGDALAIEWLLTAGGMSVDAPNQYALRVWTQELKRGVGETALHVAAANGHAFAVATLLYLNATVDALDEHKSTPLHYASRAGHAHAVEALLDAGAKWQHINGQHHIALQLASVAAASPDATRLLLAAMTRVTDAEGVAWVTSALRTTLGTAHQAMEQGDGLGDGLATVGGAWGLVECAALLQAALDGLEEARGVR